MNGKYSLPVVKAVDMIWTSFDREEIQRGYAMPFQAAQQGDADALAFVARCFMSEEYVWSGAGFAPDDANASKLMQKSALMGSATGVLCAVRSGNFTPTVQRGMPFASFKEVFGEILGQAERGNAFCCYMIGNVYFWGDYLLVEPELAKEFKTENKYYAKAAYRGNPQGAYNAGHIYEGGEEVEENAEVAYQFFGMAAQGGHPGGQFEMGYYHFEGCGGAEQDYAKAVQ